MHSKTTTVLFVMCCWAVTVYASHYASPHYGAPAVVSLPETGEAVAQADSNAAGARAAASKIRNSNRNALHQYGHDIGRPLLVRPFGALTNLYAAALPPSSFVGQIDPGFEKDSYGRIQHVGTASIGVLAL